jgi:hypothetical protein
MKAPRFGVGLLFVGLVIMVRNSVVVGFLWGVGVCWYVLVDGIQCYHNISLSDFTPLSWVFSIFEPCVSGENS